MISLSFRHGLKVTENDLLFYSLHRRILSFLAQTVWKFYASAGSIRKNKVKQQTKQCHKPVFYGLLQNYLLHAL